MKTFLPQSLLLCIIHKALRTKIMRHIKKKGKKKNPSTLPCKKAFYRFRLMYGTDIGNTSNCVEI